MQANMIKNLEQAVSTNLLKSHKSYEQKGGGGKGEVACISLTD